MKVSAVISDVILESKNDSVVLEKIAAPKQRIYPPMSGWSVP